MRKAAIFIFLIIISFFSSGCLPKKQMAALQINTFPSASVFINGKHVGKTPFVDREMNPGEITLKLIPESTVSALISWEGKLKLIGGVLTVVNREFSETEDASSGDILTLEPSKDKNVASLAVVTTPDGANVKLDGENRGISPLVLEKIEEGDHQIVLEYSGYKERTLMAKAKNGFKLIINSKLAKESEPEAKVTPSSELTPQPTKKVTPTSTPKITLTPKPTVAIAGAYVEIKETPTGWLRVRMGPSLSATEAAKVYPKEKYPFLEEKSGWYKIRYEEGKEGWVSAQYATKIEQIQD